MPVAFLPVDTRLLLGDGVIAKLIQTGKECHTGRAIFRQIGKCIMSKQEVFVRVIRGVFVRAGDTIKVIKQGRKHEKGNGEVIYPEGY